MYEEKLKPQTEHRHCIYRCNDLACSLNKNRVFLPYLDAFSFEYIYMAERSAYPNCCKQSPI